MATKITNVMGPKGATGASGAPGNPGGKGPQGDVGAAGAQGSPGPRSVSADASNAATLGSDSLIYVPPAVVPPLASPTQAGLLKQLSGLTTDFVDGTNNCQNLAAAIQSSIALVRRRAYNTVLNPTTEVDQFRVGNRTTQGYVVDRWAATIVAGTMTWMSRSIPGQTQGMPGNSQPVTQSVLEANLTAQQATMAAGNCYYISQNIEGIRARPLLGAPHSLSILAWSDATSPFQFSLSLRNSPSTVSYTKLLTHPGGFQTVWLTVPNIPVFPSATFNTPFLTRGAAGYIVGICLCSGSTFTAPNDGAWNTGNFIASPGQSNFAAFPTGTRFWICFLQHEPGAVCSYPIDANFQDTLIQCQRYYSKSNQYANPSPSSGDWMRVGSYFPTTTVRCGVQFPVEMATVPTLNFYNSAGTINTIYIDNINATTPVSSVSVSASGFQSIVVPAQAAANYCPPAFGQWNASTTF